MDIMNYYTSSRYFAVKRVLFKCYKHSRAFKKKKIEHHFKKHASILHTSFVK